MNRSSEHREMTQSHPRSGERNRGAPAVGAYVCKSGRCVYLYGRHIRHQSHPSRVTYANTRPPRLPSSAAPRIYARLGQSDKLQRHYCQFVYTPPDSRQHRDRHLARPPYLGFLHDFNRVLDPSGGLIVYICAPRAQ